MNLLAGDVGDDLAHQRAAGGAAADDDPVERIAAALEEADDVRHPVGEAAEPAGVEFLQAFEIVAQIEPDDRGARRRIGERRAVAEEFRQYVHALGEQGRPATGRPLARRDRAPAIRGPRRRLPPRSRRRPDGGAADWSIAAPKADCPPSVSH